jgi:hypothetical protein
LIFLDKVNNKYSSVIIIWLNLSIFVMKSNMLCNFLKFVFGFAMHCYFQLPKIKVKGSVQRKLRWVETGLKRCIWASDRGAGQRFIVKVSLHLVFSLFPFPDSTTQFIGEFYNNRRSAAN